MSNVDLSTRRKAVGPRQAGRSASGAAMSPVGRVAPMLTGKARARQPPAAASRATITSVPWTQSSKPCVQITGA